MQFTMMKWECTSKEENGWYWYQAPIETQALLIEAFDEITHDDNSVDLMKNLAA